MGLRELAAGHVNDSVKYDNENAETLSLQELAAEADGKAVHLNRDLLDRVLVARLIESPPQEYPQTPLQYLLGCYARCQDEQRKGPKAELAPVLQGIRELVISYAGLTLTGGIIPHPGAAVRRVGAQHVLCAAVLRHAALRASQPLPSCTPL